MKKFNFITRVERFLGDTSTPVGVYYRIRDEFACSLMMESSDYHGHENSYSYICFQPVAGLEVKNDILTVQYPDGTLKSEPLLKSELIQRISQFQEKFNISGNQMPFFTHGLAGYFNFDAIRFFEDITLNPVINQQKNIPDIILKFYRFLIVFDHFHNDMFLVAHQPDTESGTEFQKEIHRIKNLLRNRNHTEHFFRSDEAEHCNMTNHHYQELVKKAQSHIQRGDVFQLVLSRCFSKKFSGDEFNVYRCLRSINPSPYLFYFDYGSHKIFGSSPEAQIAVNNGKAVMYPIAGTVARNGNGESDSQLAEQLSADEKENAEHVMLVDMARNDLGKNCNNITVEVFREIQFYSHVIHLVSKITGDVPTDLTSEQLIADSFPAGTLSGAPKYRAVELIDELEPEKRGFYGGSIGFIGFDGTVSQAIIIRSFLSRNRTLFYQAGAGIVADSSPEKELQEVDNKLMALRKAIEMAEQMNNGE